MLGTRSHDTGPELALGPCCYLCPSHGHYTTELIPATPALAARVTDLHPIQQLQCGFPTRPLPAHKSWLSIILSTQSVLICMLIRKWVVKTWGHLRAWGAKGHSSDPAGEAKFSQALPLPHGSRICLKGKKKPWS